MKYALSFAKAFFFVAVGAALLYVVWSGSDLVLEPNPNVSSADFVSIILTALGVILAALAVFLGGMAVLSWRMFDDRVKSHVEDYLNEFVKPTERYEVIKKLIHDHYETTKKLSESEKELENLSKFDEDSV